MTTTTVHMGVHGTRRDGGGARRTGAGPLARMAHAALAAWRGALVDPLHAALDRHERLSGLEPLNAATLRDLGRF